MTRNRFSTQSTPRQSGVYFFNSRSGGGGVTPESTPVNQPLIYTFQEVNVITSVDFISNVGCGVSKRSAVINEVNKKVTFENL